MKNLGTLINIVVAGHVILVYIQPPLSCIAHSADLIKLINGMRDG